MAQECSCVLVQDESQLNCECSTTTFPTILQKLNEMRANEVVCDVFFKVGKEEKRFAAHRLILAATSDVFYANFFGPLVSKDGYTKQNSTYVPDVHPDAFELLLLYCYSICSEVAVDLVVHALYAAEKYNVEKLRTVCLKRLMNIDLKDAVTVLNQAMEYNESTIINRCLKVIDENADEVVVSKSSFVKMGLRDCDRKSLEMIISREAFNPTSQFALFREVIGFAEKQCMRMDLLYNTKNAREILVDIMPLIKFSSMSLEDVAEAVRFGVITRDEIDTFVSKNSKERRPSAPLLSGDTENCIYSLRRMSSVTKVDWMDLSTALFFQTDRNIRIRCVGIYSWCDDDKLQIDDISLMFCEYGYDTQKLKISKLHYEDNIVYIHIRDGLEIIANTKYYFCVNIAGAEGRQFFYNYSPLSISKVTTYNGLTMTLTCDNRRGNGFYPEIRFSL